MKKLKLLCFAFIVGIVSAFVSADTAVFATDNTPAEEVEFPLISREKALEDYDYMWRVLEENYPFFGVGKRALNLDLINIKHSFRVQVGKNSTQTIEDFYKTISQCLERFRHVGHLSIINGFLFQNYANIINIENIDFEEYKTLITTATNPAAIRTYEYLFPEIDFTERPSTSPEGGDDTLTLKIIDDNTAYMKVDGFYGWSVEPHGEEIKRFYTEIKDKENLIIDLTENSGGSDMYWMENYFAPNFIGEFEYSQYYLSKSGESNIEYFKERFWDKSVYEDENEFLDYLHSGLAHVSNLPNVNQDDLQSLDLAFKFTNILGNKDNKEKAFDGNIYVLTSRNVYSSSESFVMVCKATGFATLVGTNTYGDGGGFDPIIAMLPNSGICFRYSTLYTLNLDGSSNQEFGTTPDYFTERNETALDACLRIIAEQAGE